MRTASECLVGLLILWGRIKNIVQSIAWWIDVKIGSGELSFEIRMTP